MGRRIPGVRSALLLTAVSAALSCRYWTHVGTEPHVTEWRHYLGGEDSSSYSPLHQINRSNVSDLTIAWTYAVKPNKRLRFNPIIVNGVMYVLGARNAIVALDAATGKELWVHQQDPLLENDVTDRGINYWENKDGSDRRLLFATGAYLQAIDARTGRSIKSFGANGSVDLRNGLDRPPESINEFGYGAIGWTSPGRIFRNLLIVGSRTGEAYGAPPGDIRAYDVVTGRLVWTFHTVPRPGEYGYDTWPPNAYLSTGGANVWGDMTLDEHRGILYAPTASPKYDFYGGDRAGANLFGDCLLALDAQTGKRLWHFQTVHHDLWDYDNAAAPQLVSIRRESRNIDAVALAGKTGFLYVFDRTTGTPIWPIEERPVPQSDVHGEQSWPTQPFPTSPPPFSRQSFHATDINPYLDPLEREQWTKTIAASVNNGLFTPPATTDTLQMPGNIGGANWGSTATDPDTGVMYVVGRDEPTLLRLTPEISLNTRLLSLPPQVFGKLVYEQQCQACHGEDLRGASQSIPSLVGVTERLDAHAIKRIVLFGQKRMPNFSLGDKELTALIVFFSKGPMTSNNADVSNAPEPAVEPTRYWSGFGYMKPKTGPAIVSPPWSTITAYDISRGTIKWQIPLGEVPKLAAAGVHGTGAGDPRGILVTGGGLIFAATPDNTFRVYDKDTGLQLWAQHLAVNPTGIAATYEIDGRQYVVIACSTPDEPMSSSQNAPEALYVTFALHRQSRSAEIDVR